MKFRPSPSGERLRVQPPSPARHGSCNEGKSRAARPLPEGEGTERPAAKQTAETEDCKTSAEDCSAVILGALR